MSDFKALSCEEQARRLALLAARALPRFGLPTDCALTLINHRENAVFRVDDKASATSYAMRVHREQYQDEQSIRSELQWMKALREAGVATPDIITGSNGDPIQTVAVAEVPEPRHCDLFGWIEGPTLDAENPETFRFLGQLNARIHEHASKWKRPPGFQRQCWDEEGLVGDNPILGRFWDLAALSRQQVALLVRARDMVREQLTGFGKGPDRFGLVHADLMPDNIIVSDGIPRVIDFDDCGFGWLMNDVATVMTLIVSEQDRYRRLLDAWVQGYRSVTELPDDHLVIIKTLIMARFLVLLGWLHTRRETRVARDYTEIMAELACQYARSCIES